MPSIEEYRVVQFARGITHLAQQRNSRLRGGVSVDPSIVGKRATYDQLEGSGEPQEVVTRHAPTPINDPSHQRRNLIPKDYVRAAMVDEEDIQKILNDPRNAYSESFAAGFGRSIDSVLITAATATSITGEEGIGTAPFPAAFSIPVGGAGMSIAKWRQARRILEAAEELEDEDMNSWHIAMTAQAREDLLATTEITSADFNTIRALVNGQINSFLGMMPHKSQRLAGTGTASASQLAWIKSGLKLGIGREPSADISRRKDLSNNWQVLYKGSYGATRMRETAVVEILTDES